MRQRKGDSELHRFADNFGFRKPDQRRVNLKPCAFRAGLCRKVGKGLKRLDEFRATIGVATIINCVYSEKNVTGWNYLRPGKRISQKDGVARGDVRDRNSMREFLFGSLFGHIDVIRQRRTAKDAQVDVGNAMFFYA